MYTRSARIYDCMYHFKDYTEASGGIRALLAELHPGARSMLDVACSTGRHLEHLRSHYEVEGLDINPELLEVARDRCPDVPFHVGDMMAFDLGRKFDVVSCLFSSIAYARTRENLGKAIARLAAHLNPGGVLLVEPWLTPDQYWVDNIVLNTASCDGMKIAWMYVGKVVDGVVTNEINYLVGTAEGVTQFSETHHMGLFDLADYEAAIRAAGLELLEYDEKGFFGNGLFCCRAPARSA